MSRQITAGLLAGALIAAPTHAGAQMLGMGAGAQGSQNYAVNGVLTNLFSEELGLDIRMQSYGGSGQTMPMIDGERLDLQAIVAPDTIAGALGAEPFEDLDPLENLRLIGSLGGSHYGFFVDDDSPHESVSDIAGERITYGYTEQPTLRLQVDGILANGGLTVDDMEAVMAPAVPRGADDFIAGQADVVFFALRGGKVQEADAATGIRWLQLSEDPEAEAAMQEHVPGSYVDVIEPAEGISGLAEPTAMMAYDYWLVVGAHVDDELVYEITQTLAENADEVAGLHGTLSGFDPNGMADVDTGGVRFHPGAEAYYQDAGLWPDN